MSHRSRPKKLAEPPVGNIFVISMEKAVKGTEILFSIGIIWTYVNIKKNWDHYRSYPSVVTQSSL